jgi:uncharacterized membrane protein
MSNSETAQSSPPPSSARPSPIVERNVRALVEHAAEQERARSTADRVAAVISRFAGSMNFVYFHLVAYGLWAIEGLGWLPGIHGYDTSFTILGTTASVEAIFLATFVLIAQNRMLEQADVRNRLDVQVGLLTELEATHILRIVAAMSEKMEIDTAKNSEIQELLRETAPQDMLEKIEEETDAVESEIRTDSAKT